MRKLAIATAAFSAAVFAANFIESRVLVRILILLFAAAGCVMLLFRKNRRIFVAILAVFPFALGLLCFNINYDRTVCKALAVSDIEKEYTARVVDYPSDTETYSRIPVKIIGAECRGLKAYIYDYDGRLSALKPGMNIRFRASLRYVGDERYDNYDYLLSSGFFLRGEFSSEVYSSASYSVIPALPVIIKKALVDTCYKAFPVDTSPFFVSLLTGDKSGLYKTGTTYLDLSRAGFVHIVAVSGMHVAFVVGLFRTLFGKNRRLSLLCIILVWFFVAVTGFSPSAVRAGIMQTVLLLAPVFYRENDTITSLCFALSLILLLNPFSAKSVSLQLSFGATLGICLFSRRINSDIISCFRSEPLRRLFKYPAGIFSVSISASCFTVPLCIIHFGTVALISPITNLLALWAVPVCFAGSAAVCIIYYVIPQAVVFCGKIISIFARYIFFICRSLSRIPFSAVYSDSFYAVLTVIIVYLCIILVSLSKDSGSFKFLFSSVVSFFVLALFFSFNFLSSRVDDVLISAIDVGQGQCIAVSSKGRTVLIDCGSSSYDYDAGVCAADSLRSDCIYSVDTIILTHFHSDHSNGVSRFIQLMGTGSIIMPDMRDVDDGTMSGIINAANDAGVKVYLVDSHCKLSVGNIVLELFPENESIADDNEACMAVKASVEDLDVLVTGDSYADREVSLLSQCDMSDIEVLVAGHHGSKTSTCDDLLDATDCSIAIISVSKNNNYGHPASEVLERLRSYGCSIYRTDLNGKISVRYTA